MNNNKPRTLDNKVNGSGTEDNGSNTTYKPALGDVKHYKFTWKGSRAYAQGVPLSKMKEGKHYFLVITPYQEVVGEAQHRVNARLRELFTKFDEY